MFVTTFSGDTAPCAHWGWAKAAELAAEPASRVVVIPVGSVEQHGPHLPVMVDARLVGEVAGRVAALEPKVVVTPVVWTGLADHHQSFGGTFSLATSTFEALIHDLCASLARQGHLRVFLLNGHGGNTRTLDALAPRLAVQLGISIMGTTYWRAAAGEFADILESQTGLMHACEAETSMMLALEPDLVDEERMTTACCQPTDGLTMPDGTMRPFAEVTPTGVIGDARSATAAKGERLLAAAARAVAAVIADPATWQGDGR